VVDDRVDCQADQAGDVPGVDVGLRGVPELAAAAGQPGEELAARVNWFAAA
jgi:hypothetical protein